MAPKTFRRTAAGVALALALLATPVAQASPARDGWAVRAERSIPGWTLLKTLWDFLIGTDPFSPQPTQGPTVDPNGGGVS